MEWVLLQWLSLSLPDQRTVKMLRAPQDPLERLVCRKRRESGAGRWGWFAWGEKKEVCESLWEDSRHLFMRKINAGTLVTVLSIKEWLWWLWLTFSNYTFDGKRSRYKNLVISKMSDYNFWAVRKGVFSFFCRIIDRLLSCTSFLLFLLRSHLPLHPLLSFPLSCLLREVNCKWPCFPSLIIFFVPFVVTFSATSHGNSRDKMIGEEMEKQRECDEGGNKEKRKHLSDGRGGVSKPLMDLTPYKNAENTRLNRRKYKYTGEGIKTTLLVFISLPLFCSIFHSFDLQITMAV